MATPIRHPAVAGRFYPRDPDDLRTEVQSYCHHPGKQSRRWAAWYRTPAIFTPDMSREQSTPVSIRPVVPF